MKVTELFESDDNHVFTKPELLKIFEPFLDRLELDHGNDREEMIRYHIDRLVGKPKFEVLRLMPRGPKGYWTDLMADIRDTIRQYPDMPVREAWSEEAKVKHTGRNTNKSVAKLKKERTAAKKRGDSKAVKQKDFAIRAKTGWGSAK